MNRHENKSVLHSGSWMNHFKGMLRILKWNEYIIPRLHQNMRDKASGDFFFLDQLLRMHH